MIEAFLTWVVEFVRHFGYLGIFIMTFLESTFVPIPSEMTMIPAGYLVGKGEMSFFLVLLFGITGTVSGAMCNYGIAYYFGRALILRWGRYFFMNEKKLQAIERFFARHGAISTFTGRLILGVRHYISFPAGLAKMQLKLFVFYTALGGILWLLILIGLGAYIGRNEQEISYYLPLVKFGVSIAAGLLLAWYLHKKHRAAPSPHDQPGD